MATANLDWDDDDDFDADEPRGNDVPDLRKAHRALKRQFKELEQQYNDMRAQVRERSVKDVLAAKGISEKVSRLIPETITTSEEVDQWLADFGDVFGIKQEQPPTDGQPDPLADNPDVEALKRITGAQSAGQTFSGDADQLASLIASATDEAALNKILFGNATGPAAI